MVPERSRMSRTPLLATLAAALLVATLSGCFGVPPGAADTGDEVTIRYTVYDLGTGAALRENRTVAFVVGSGASGLGDQVERSVRGHLPNETYTVTVRDDASLGYTGLIEVNRTLAPIPREQSAPRADFEQFVGPASVGQVFDAYGIYDGVVTEVRNQTVLFRIEAAQGQVDPVPSVGARLVTTVGETELTRTLEPVVGQTFTIAPPTPFQPSTPLGLEPGSYKVLGATDTKLQYSRSASAAADLIGKDLRVEVTILDVHELAEAVPTDGNFGARDGSPQVNGDPSSVLGGPVPTATHADDGHDH
jgi:FKBP-type peptidyl-prolyl cis-trans isomerase 2